MPCKFMFTIMDHTECASWPSFLQKYRQSPFLRLGNTEVNEDGITNQPNDNSTLENNIENNQVKQTKYTELKYFYAKIKSIYLPGTAE